MTTTKHKYLTILSCCNKCCLVWSISPHPSFDLVFIFCGYCSFAINVCDIEH
ncbi:hypothetical protein I79_010009 [Cricetulus griseus]|uniref:Uncharacterized protein n=1 Tax=Cricetulus griseus TaxID=10029 RepID=G3HHB1_CRIGR|nr:hypothetical protein I79_010009 [Cricetulus griseus]